MKRIFILVFGIVIGAAGSSVITGARSATFGSRTADVTQATNAAYRDGMFLGKLDSRSGRGRHACVARWSASADRSSFAAGYEAGYARF